MSNAIEGLRRKINSATELQSVVRTMKALAAASIGQYERSVLALSDYNRTVELGLSACFRQRDAGPEPTQRPEPGRAEVIGAVVFGSDQGLVGQFNETVAAFASEALAAWPGERQVWAVGERVGARLSAAGLAPGELFAVPNSVQSITSLVAQILEAIDRSHAQRAITELRLFFNHPTLGAAYAPVSRRLLPLDRIWRRDLAERAWPTKNMPEVLCGRTATLRSLIREYLFISLFRACAESLASENASRLAAMERADKNIDDLLESLQAAFHHLRQSDIDDELFDLVAGAELLREPRRRPPPDGIAPR